MGSLLCGQHSLVPDVRARACVEKFYLSRMLFLLEICYLFNHHDSTEVSGNGQLAERHFLKSGTAMALPTPLFTLCVCVCVRVWCGVVWCGVVWCGVVWCVCMYVCMYVQYVYPSVHVCL